MGSRSTSRKLALQLLYQSELRNLNINILTKEFLSHEQYPEETKQHAVKLAHLAYTSKKEQDELIDKLAINWDIERLNIVDKCIIKIAITELHLATNPFKVIMNETLELARQFSDESSIKFINGILKNFVKDKSCSQE